jgi:hypothetical protein
MKETQETINKKIMKQTKKRNFGLFWTLIREIDGYKEAFKDVIKEGVVHQYSGGKTESLTEMFEKYPEEYARMMTALKGDHNRKQSRYDKEIGVARGRVIAVICKWVDKMGYKFGTKDEKLEYVKGVAARSADAPSFNKIPLSRMSAVYNLFLKKNKVDVSRCAELEVPVCNN